MGHRIAKHVYSSNNVWEKSTFYVLDAQGNTMSVYEHENDDVNQVITYAQTEKHIYGASRLGINNEKIPMFQTQNLTYSMKLVTHRIGERAYELSNHLGNVLSVISDKVIPHANGTAVDYYMADIRQSQDYSPFGVELSGRTLSKSGLTDFTRYGFNSMEKDDEIKGSGNSCNFGARMYDSRLGRFFTLDKYLSKFPSDSPYSFAGNSPIICIDANGDFKIVISEDAKKKYNLTNDKLVRFTEVVNDLGNYLKQNPTVLATLSKQSGYTESEILDACKPNSAPTLFIEDRSEEAMVFQVDEQDARKNRISLDAQTILNFETQTFTSDANEVAYNLVFASAVLHELVHLGDRLNNNFQITGETKENLGVQGIQSPVGHRGLEVQMKILGIPVDVYKSVDIPSPGDQIAVETKDSNGNKAIIYEADPKGTSYQNDANMQKLTKKVSEGKVNVLPKDK